MSIKVRPIQFLTSMDWSIMWRYCDVVTKVAEMQLKKGIIETYLLWDIHTDCCYGNIK